MVGTGPIPLLWSGLSHTRNKAAFRRVQHCGTCKWKREHLSSYSWNQYSTFHTLERNPGFVVFYTKAGYVNVSLLIWTRSYYRPTVMYTLEMVGQCQPSTFANKGLNLILFELFLFSTHTSCKDISL